MSTRRKMLVMDLIILALLIGASLAFGGDVVVNGSFEAPESQLDNPFGDLAAGWGRWGNWVNRETDWKPTKKGGCLMGYHHWRIEEGDTSGFYQDILEVAEGSPVTFTVYVSRDKDTNAESVELRIEKLNGEGQIASQIYPVQQIAGGWDKLSVSGVSSGEGVRVVVVVKPRAEGERKGALKFDEAEVNVKKGGMDGSGVVTQVMRGRPRI